MRKASYVLGIVGGCLALVGALMYILGGILFLAGGEAIVNTIQSILTRFNVLDLVGDNGFWLNSLVIGFGGMLMIGLGVLYAAAGILGLVGACSVRKNNTKAGVLMLVAAALSLLAGFGFILMVLFLLGGIFALVKDKEADTPAPQQ